MIEELGQIGIAALIGFAIGYLMKKEKLEKEISTLNQDITSLLGEVRVDLEEARIERNALSDKQTIVMELLQTYEGHYQSTKKQEEKKQQAEKRAEKRAKTTEGKIGNLKRDNNID